MLNQFETSHLEIVREGFLSLNRKDVMKKSKNFYGGCKGWSCFPLWLSECFRQTRWWWIIQGLVIFKNRCKQLLYLVFNLTKHSLLQAINFVESWTRIETNIIEQKRVAPKHTSCLVNVVSASARTIGDSRSWISTRQSSVGVATSIIHARYLE